MGTREMAFNQQLYLLFGLLSTLFLIRLNCESYDAVWSKDLNVLRSKPLLEWRFDLNYLNEYNLYVAVCAAESIVAQECNWNFHLNLSLRFQYGAESRDVPL